MPGAKASGADAGEGSARSRDHKQGNQGRSFTPDQKAAVLRIRKCNPTAFYDILGLETVKTTCTESEIKKAYRKLSLLTHPDKNGYEHADEAFKMVSRAFGILGDKEKREKFDRLGTDPDSRFASAQAQNPFSGFASRQAGGGMGRGGPGGMWEEELTPEEMFARFFGGGGGPFGGEQDKQTDTLLGVQLSLTKQDLTQVRNSSSTLAEVLAFGYTSLAAVDREDGQGRQTKAISSRRPMVCKIFLAYSLFFSSSSCQ